MSTNDLKNDISNTANIVKNDSKDLLQDAKNEFRDVSGEGMRKADDFLNSTKNESKDIFQSIKDTLGDVMASAKQSLASTFTDTPVHEKNLALSTDPITDENFTLAEMDQMTHPYPGLKEDIKDLGRYVQSEVRDQTGVLSDKLQNLTVSHPAAHDPEGRPLNKDVALGERDPTGTLLSKDGGAYFAPDLKAEHSKGILDSIKDTFSGFISGAKEEIHTLDDKFSHAKQSFTHAGDKHSLSDLKPDYTLNEFKNDAKDLAQDAKNSTRDFSHDLKNTASDKGNTFKNDAKDFTHSVKKEAADIAHNMKNDAKDLAQDMKNGTRDFTHDLKNNTSDMANSFKNSAKDLGQDIKNEARDVSHNVKNGLDDMAHPRPHFDAEETIKNIKDTATHMLETTEEVIHDAFVGTKEAIKDAMNHPPVRETTVIETDPLTREKYVTTKLNTLTNPNEELFD